VRYCSWKVHTPVPLIHGLEQLNMTSYPLSNVLLPAVIISSAVFSTLTLPFAFINKEPVAVELPFYTGEIQPIFNGEHKDVAIPYVGLNLRTSLLKLLNKLLILVNLVYLNRLYIIRPQRR
jgi:hypothetical protein